jgi:hypothetical protein
MPGFRFQKRIRLAKGLTLNLSKKGVSSVRVGRKGLGISTGRRGTRIGASVPGTGLSTSRRVGAGCLMPLVFGIIAVATVAVVVG